MHALNYFSPIQKLATVDKICRITVAYVLVLILVILAAQKELIKEPGSRGHQNMTLKSHTPSRKSVKISK